MKKMMMIIALSMMCVWTQTVKAQDVLKSIRSHYAAAKTYVQTVEELEKEGETYPVPAYFLARIKQNLPATGYHEEEVRMYYQEEEVDEIYPPLYLDFATVKYNFAARDFYEEYLYDEKGNIQFIYGTTPDIDDDKFHEFRFYFHHGKFIEMLVKSKDHPEGEYTTEYSGKSIPAKYENCYQEKLAFSSKIMRLFNSLNDVRHI